MRRGWGADKRVQTAASAALFYPRWQSPLVQKPASSYKTCKATMQFTFMAQSTTKQHTCPNTHLPARAPTNPPTHPP